MVIFYSVLGRAPLIGRDHELDHVVDRSVPHSTATELGHEHAIIGRGEEDGAGLLQSLLVANLAGVPASSPAAKDRTPASPRSS